MVLKYLSYFEEEEIITTEMGKKIKVLHLNVCKDDNILNEWASHFRKHYCSDEEIDDLRYGYGMTREEFLRDIKLPDRSSLGSATRSGDFSEILVADYVEFILNYFVPRIRYDGKFNRNTSTQGSDFIAFKVDNNISENDELMVFEVKAQASNKKPKNKLQEAIEHSNKDIFRIGVSLNAINQRLRYKGLIEDAKKVQRFQNATDKPYKQKYGAAAVHSNFSYSEKILLDVTTEGHHDPNLELVVIHRENLMEFIHELYERACGC
ncbi:Hachiman antiphage defense system protein HamA [Listeria booriae]|uniref:Hachiman antiphage defense system protein HamA n=1 Tax=Listeria booriae TaxID=1552123 RepID=UPI00162AB667|nr:Hachiman antiphage defense system protein HamA [Listeria booriae]MBC2047189.1 DUF1837 domain-containing protein [Listeria booriae]